MKNARTTESLVRTVTDRSHEAAQAHFLKLKKNPNRTPEETRSLQRFEALTGAGSSLTERQAMRGQEHVERRIQELEKKLTRTPDESTTLRRLRSVMAESEAMRQAAIAAALGLEEEQ